MNRANRAIQHGLSRVGLILLQLRGVLAAAQDGHEFIATAVRDMLFARNPGFQQKFCTILRRDVLGLSYYHRRNWRQRDCTGTQSPFGKSLVGIPLNVGL